MDRETLKGIVDWWFRDRQTGKILVAHRPNLPILLWMATVVTRWLVAPGSSASTLLAWAGSVTLGWWAVDELVRGVNPWRRALGVVGCIAVIAGVVSRVA